MSKYTWYIMILVAFAFGCNEAAKEDMPNITDFQEAVSTKMKAQENAWNEGDLEGFMSAYWKSDSLSFIGKSGLKRGWTTTLENYQRSYATPEEMGQLVFKNEVVDLVDSKTGWVVGMWQLNRVSDTLSGYYSLIWQRRAEGWVIIADHSS